MTPDTFLCVSFWTFTYRNPSIPRVRPNCFRTETSSRSRWRVGSRTRSVGFGRGQIWCVEISHISSDRNQGESAGSWWQSHKDTCMCVPQMLNEMTEMDGWTQNVVSHLKKKKNHLFIYLLIVQYKRCDIMVHCRHASIHQLLGNQLLLGADATTRVLIITGSITIFSRNK